MSQRSRSILIVTGIVTAPVAILVMVFGVVYTSCNQGEGPNDGALMAAGFVSIAAALLVAVPLWSVGLIYLVCKRGRKSIK